MNKGNRQGLLEYTSINCLLNSPQVEQPFFQSFLYGCISFHIYLYFFITIESSFWKFSKRINMHFLVKTNCPFRNSTKLKSHLYDNLCLTYIRYKYHLEVGTPPNQCTQAFCERMKTLTLLFSTLHSKCTQYNLLSFILFTNFFQQQVQTIHVTTHIAGQHHGTVKGTSQELNHDSPQEESDVYHHTRG